LRHVLFVIPIPNVTRRVIKQPLSYAETIKSVENTKIREEEQALHPNGIKHKHSVVMRVSRKASNTRE